MGGGKKKGMKIFPDVITYCRGNGQIIGQSYVLIHSPEESLLFQENFLSYSSFLHILFQNREREREVNRVKE